MSVCKFVDQGFAFEAESWRLQSHLFPSKIGGKPAWLSLKTLPKSEDLKCGNCKEVCKFLLQLYSPIDNDPSAFHRTIFVFVCQKLSCHNSSNSIIVLRSSLPRKNSFYSSEPPDYDQYDDSHKHPSAGDFNKLCVVCGCLGDKMCSKCHNSHYCCKEHQVDHWRAGHKTVCQTGNTQKVSEIVAISKLVLPEYGFEMKAEKEEDDDDDDDESNSNDDDDDHISVVKEAKAITNGGEKGENEEVIIDEKSTANYQNGVLDKVDLISAIEVTQRIKYNVLTNAPDIPHHFKLYPSIKYARGGTLVLNEEGELVVKAENIQKSIEDTTKVDSKIPNCEICGTERVFEFLILPRLLGVVGCVELMKLFKAVAVFTCKNNCLKSATEENDLDSLNYFKEFVLKLNKF